MGVEDDHHPPPFGRHLEINLSCRLKRRGNCRMSFRHRLRLVEFGVLSELERGKLITPCRQLYPLPLLATHNE